MIYWPAIIYKFIKYSAYFWLLKFYLYPQNWNLPKTCLKIKSSQIIRKNWSCHFIHAMIYLKSESPSRAQWVPQREGSISKVPFVKYSSPTCEETPWSQDDENRGSPPWPGPVTPEGSLHPGFRDREAAKQCSHPRPHSLLAHPQHRPSPVSSEVSPSSERTLFIPTKSTFIPLPFIQIPPALHGPIQNPKKCNYSTQREPFTKMVTEMMLPEVMPHGGPNPNSAMKSLPQTAQQVDVPSFLNLYMYLMAPITL